MAGPSTADIAREVDRLVIAVHRRVMSTDRAKLEALMAAVGPPDRGYFYDLAEFLAAGLCTNELARRRFPYDPDDGAATMIDRLRDDERLDDRLQLVAPLSESAEKILAIRAEVAAELWDTDLASVLFGAGEALAVATGSLVATFRLVPEPTAQAHLLHHLLTGLRYARLEAHVAAWTAAGLTAQEIVALDAALRRSEPGASAPDELVGRGWLTADGSATTAGRLARAAIETDTDARCEAMFDAITDRPAWFSTLQNLPS